MMKKENKKDRLDRMLQIITLPLVIICFVVFLCSTVIHIINMNDPLMGSKPSELGDFLGGYLGSLLSIFTVVLVYKTYLSQKEELKEQREGFELTRSFDLMYKEFDLLQRATAEFQKKEKFNIMIEGLTEQINLLKKSPSSINFQTEFSKSFKNITNYARELQSIFGMFNYLMKESGNNFSMRPIIHMKIDNNLVEYLQKVECLIDVINKNKDKIKNYDSAIVLELRLQVSSALTFFTPPPRH